MGPSFEKPQTGMKLENLKERSKGKVANTRLLTEKLLVLAIAYIAKVQDSDEEKVFTGLLDEAGFSQASEEEEATEEEEEEETDPMADILEGNVEEVEEAMIDLDGPSLKHLVELEESGKNRKGVLDAAADALANLSKE